jgi:DNA uptake protein ComE-like DNA-binding protein
MAKREANDREAGRVDTLRAAQSLAFLVSVGICLALASGFAVRVFERSEGSPLIRSGERINPNEAPTASLRRLPQIGAARARAIVAHRDRVGIQRGQPPAFKTADDLRQIRGIGPAIVEDVRPWLQFDDLGFSLKVKDPKTTDANSLNGKNAWRPSASVGGSPGTRD